jgi:HSP20 family protein
MANQLRRFDPFSDIARFDPFNGIAEWSRDFDVRPSLRETGVPPRIKVDVSETDSAFTVTAEIPGAKREDLKVDVDGNKVSIRAELKRESQENQGAMLCCERFFGEQRRSFTLAQDIDETNVMATYLDGVLSLTLPKKMSKPATQIAVS